MIEARVPARVGLLGNPSDGYGGKCLSLAIDNFAATVRLERTDDYHVEVVPGPDDRRWWRTSLDLVDWVDRYGLGTGDSLLTATIRTFLRVVDSVDHQRPAGFRLSYETDIPRQVGLAGSSALVVGALQCLAEFVDLDLPPDALASIALSVETETLGITAGLQDRVAQSYGGLVAMDFSSMDVDARFAVSTGRYTPLDADALPPLFLAYHTQAAAESGIYHQDLRVRHDSGDQMVGATMRSLAHLVPEGRAALTWQDADGSRAEHFGRLIARNMELRGRFGGLTTLQQLLVDTAEQHGWPVTSTGSGGAVVGVWDGKDLSKLAQAFGSISAEVEAIVPAPSRA